MQCYGQDGSFGFGVFISVSRKMEICGPAQVPGYGAGNPVRRNITGIRPPANQFSGFSKSDDGRLLIGTPLGLEELAGETVEAAPDGDPRAACPMLRRLLRDRDGGLWIGTEGRGLLHVHQGRTDQFTRTDGLSADIN